MTGPPTCHYRLPQRMVCAERHGAAEVAAQQASSLGGATGRQDGPDCQPDAQPGRTPKRRRAPILQKPDACCSMAVVHSAAAAKEDPRLPALLAAVAEGCRLEASVPAKSKALRAAELLADLAGNHEQRHYVLASSALHRLSALLRQGGAKGRAVAALALGRLTAGGAVEVARELSKCAADIVHLLVVLLQEDEPVGRVGAAMLLANLSHLPELREPIVAVGAVHLLLALLQPAGAAQACAPCAPREDTEADVARLLSNLAACRRLCGHLVDVGAVSSLTALLAQGRSAEGKIRAALALRNLATESAERKAAITKAGAVPGLVVLLGSSEAKGELAAATALLELASEPMSAAAIAAHAGALPALAATVRSGLLVDSRDAAADALRLVVGHAGGCCASEVFRSLGISELPK